MRFAVVVRGAAVPPVPAHHTTETPPPAPGPEFEDHPELTCPDCGKPVVRLATTAAGVAGRWRKGCAEHSTGRKEAAGGPDPDPSQAQDDGQAEGEEEAADPAPA